MQNLSIKPHYQILDGLRGVAAITVLFFHLFEIFSGGDHTKQIINHGYLGVDFFYVLSGFVIAYAYDNRWQGMTYGQFFKRRLIRLHPMILVGMTVGALCFYPSAAPDLFPNVSQTSLESLLVILLLGYLLVPVPISMDIRGWTEMFPLNGPAWTLFFEYLANVFYAVFFRKISTLFLAILVAIAGCALAHYAITSPKGDLIGGWAIDAHQIRIGFTRLLYPFMAGLLLSRLFKPIKIENAFVWCSLLVVAILAFPRIGGHESLWQNGLYDALAVICLFPLIVYLGACGSIKNAFLSKFCKFLGDISYPLYIVHFPIAYVFYAWVVNNKIPIEQAWPVGVLVALASIALAYLCFRFYDLPVRKWLGSKNVASK